MSDFVLEISGIGASIVLQAVGTIDLAAAGTILAALDSLGAEGVELRLDHVTAMTPDAQQALAGRGLATGVLAGSAS